MGSAYFYQGGCRRGASSGMTERDFEPSSINSDDLGIVSTVDTISIVDLDTDAERALGPVVSTLAARTSVFRSPETFIYSFRDTPGCVLYDVELATQAGLDFQAELAKRGCHSPVIMMGQHPTLQSVVEGMEAGAETFLQKPLDADRAVRYVEAALAKDRHHRQMREKVRVVRDRYDQLTAKEREVIDRILLGSTNREIAASLGISVRAVEDRRSRIMRRMEASSLVHLVDLVRAAESAG
eukprot:TRINITY_DN30921_c0_g1_i6.p1 TRINITY_DN30921_c0_g1~~TRINITY_DN30921_c0_g1_i6.p1  ORF type:complete len:240 (+),score=22.58 TRINITY_DN30921_c0_g1_i6:107-826(+)